MCGVDLTRIDGIDVTTALAVVSETGADMTRYPSVGHFASWLGLCPGTRITGGKVMSGKTNRAAQALRLAAAALRCAAASRRWVRTSVECVRAWISPKRQPLPRTSWRG